MILYMRLCILVAVLGFIRGVMLRKEIRNLTRQEWDDYTDAILIYKYEGRKDGKDYMINYDHMVAQHAIASMNLTCDQAHEWAAFIVWHSIFVREFEIALQSINPNVSVPYWDWTIDSTSEDPAKSVIFTDEYFGSSLPLDELYVVNSSKLAYWPINDDPLNISGVWWQSPYGFLRGTHNYNPSPYLTRYVGSSGQRLPSSAEFNQCIYQGNYSYFFACEWGTTDDQSEIHAGVHMFAGGSWTADDDADDGMQLCMGDVLDFNTSPNDPLWFSHHAQLDRLHYLWMQFIGDSLATDEDPCGGYYGEWTPSPQPPGHNLWDTFVPPFYAYRTKEEMVTLGGLNVSEACYWLNPARCNYTYPAYTNEQYDDYYGYYDDYNLRVPTDHPTHAPTTIGEESPTPAPTISLAPTKSPRPTRSPTVHGHPTAQPVEPTSDDDMIKVLSDDAHTPTLAPLFDDVHRPSSDDAHAQPSSDDEPAPPSSPSSDDEHSSPSSDDDHRHRMPSVDSASTSAPSKHGRAPPTADSPSAAPSSKPVSNSKKRSSGYGSGSDISTSASSSSADAAVSESIASESTFKSALFAVPASYMGFVAILAVLIVAMGYITSSSGMTAPGYVRMQ